MNLVLVDSFDEPGEGADEGEAYARKLKDAGVTVAAVRYNGAIHDFVLLNAIRNVPSTDAAIDQINEGLRKHLGQTRD